ncbi:uncharacterized protein [Nicotiana tomentosiformis]|uniref:uncharacterized protein n=1 Tax=Nicotiana tomentosiformis TaxID=4098 RepID=UPI00388C412F
MVRDFPRLRRGAPPQITQAPRIPPDPQASQAMVTAPVATPPAQPARGGGRTGRGRPRGGGQARYYALPIRTEAVSSDSVITGIVRVCYRDVYDLFDPSSTYSYVSSYFDPYLGISRDCLGYPIYVSTPVGDSLVVDRVYQSCLVVLSGFDTRADLLLLSMAEFDVILANVVADALSRKAESVGNLAYLPVVERPLAFDIQILANQLVGLDVSEPSLVRLVWFIGLLIMIVSESVSMMTPICLSSRTQFSTAMPRRSLLAITVYYGCRADYVFHEFILQEAYSSRYSIHPGAAKMYQDLRKHYWWRRMKKGIVEYVAQCLNSSM